MAGAVAAAGAVCAGTTRVAGTAAAGRITPAAPVEVFDAALGAVATRTARATLEERLPAEIGGSDGSDDVGTEANGSTSDDDGPVDGDSMTTDVWRPRVVAES